MTANDTNARGNYWAVILDGQPADLDDWQWALQPPFDPWIEASETGANQRRVLRSAEFAPLTISIEVRDRALLVLGTLSGAVRAATGASRIKFAGLDEVQPDGKKIHHLSANDFSVGRPHLGRPELLGGRPLTPKPSSAQHWYMISTSNPVLADMLRHHGQQVDWYNLYKTFEGVRRLSGSERTLVTKSWAPSASELRRFKQTAHYYHRHAYDPSRPAPKNPMSLTDAATMINGMVRAVLRELT
jgi:hypothetical protein